MQSLTSIRIALVQMAVGKNKLDNVAHACKMICEAKQKGSNLVVLPECFNSPYGTKYFGEYAEEIPKGETCIALSKAAKDNGIFLVGGSIPEKDGDKLYNTCTVWNPEGRFVGKFRKVHLFDIDIPGGVTFKESDSLSPGRNVSVIDVGACKVGIGICYDLRFHELATVYRDLGVDLLLYPGAFNMTTGPLHWEHLIKARAVDNQVFAAGICGARDESADYVAWGHSVLIDPWGKVVTKAEASETTLIADIDLNVCKAIREQIPIRKQRRTDLYETRYKGEVQEGEIKPSLKTNKYRKESLSKMDVSTLRQMNFNFGFWNVLTLNRPGALESLLDIMDARSIDVLALQEINWTGKGIIKRTNHTIYYSCDDNSPILGTGFIVSGAFRRKTMDFKPISPRICSIRIKVRFSYYTLISCLAPSDSSSDEEKRQFYDSLEYTIKKCRASDIKIIAGDFNAEVGKEEIYGITVGKFSLHDVSNDNGYKLINFCASQNLFIGGTCFHHKNIHKGTWHSPDGLTVKQVDHLLMSVEHKTTLIDVRAYRGVNFASDHYLAVAVIRPTFIQSLIKRKGNKIKITKIEDPSLPLFCSTNDENLKPTINDSEILQYQKSTENVC